MASRFEPDTKTMRQPFNVVALSLGSIEKGAVRQANGTGKIIGQPDTQQRAGIIACHARIARKLINKTALLQKPQLRRHLEGALPMGQARR